MPRRRRSRNLCTASRSYSEDASGATLPILYIAGFGRSGSTLLDRLLGSTAGLHSGGEIDSVWTLGLVEDRLCSCGASFSGCPFWQAVGSNSFSSLRTHEIDAIVRYTRSAFPAVKMWRILSSRTRKRLVNSAPAPFLDVTNKLYQGLRDASARQVVVDSSKLATYLVLLAQIPSMDIHVVHLVRDPRAVAHSWLRPPEADPEGRTSMPRFGAAKSAALWLTMNIAVEWVARRWDLPYVRIRYEDLVEDRARIVGQLRSTILGDGDGYGDLDFGEAGEDVDLGVAHSISGNPMRFRQGLTPVAEDAEWKTGPRSRKAIVAAITFPLRWRYGYGRNPWRPNGRCPQEI